MGGPLVLRTVIDEMRSNWIEIDVGSSDREMALRLHRLGVVALLEELARRLIALVSNLSVPLGDAFNERPQRFLLKRSQQEMHVIRHETQSMSANLRAREMSIHQAQEEEIVARVRE